MTLQDRDQVILDRLASTSPMTAEAVAGWVASPYTSGQLSGFENREAMAVVEAAKGVRDLHENRTLLPEYYADAWAKLRSALEAFNG